MKRLHITLPSELVDQIKERRCKHGVSASWQMRHFLVIGMQAEQALALCGIAGIYGEFTGPADAIEQMSAFVKDNFDEVMPMDTIEMPGSSM